MGMIILVWPLVILFTCILYAGILISLPFSTTAATVFLFTLMAYWSRLPGVGIPSPLWILYAADIIDLLSLIVAINIGGIYGALLSLFANIGGRMSGAFTDWGGNISDAIAMFVTCLIIPHVHVMLGGDLFTSMIAFMIIRLILIVPLDLVGLYSLPIPAYLGTLAVFTGALLFFNSFYTKMFGDFLDNLLVSGVAFNWTLFTFATLVIVISYLVMFVFSEKGNRKILQKNIKGLSLAVVEQVTFGRLKKKETSESSDEETEEKIEEEKKEETKKEAPIETIEKGCPVCETDIKGNDKAGFYCSGCNILFNRKGLKMHKVKEK